MPNNYVLLETIALTQSAASVTFDNLPTSGYTDLKIVSSSRASSTASGGSIITFNGSSANMSTRGLYGNGSSAASYSAPNSLGNLVTQSVNTANTFANSELYIPNYRSSTFKSSSMDGVTENNATGALAFFNANLWSQTAAITSITLNPEGLDSYVAGSTFSLYGVAALGTTPVLAPKATGGNSIENDGTYWIHTFTSSGVFTPQVGLTCDVLVVAGAGGGGNDVGGGGGAGGYRTASAFSVANGTNYPVTIGSGGAGGTSGLNGTTGSDSIFSTVTATGGGGGGKLATNGISGGSGGGGGGNSASTGGSGNTPSTSPSQGNNGGSVTGVSGGGGGGGASAVGASTTTGPGGDGGAGTASSITGTSVTRAGGGGGGTRATGGPGGAGGAGGGGAGGASTSAAGTAGTINTGGGGGGGALNNGTGGAGGSGIVIIRYPVN